MAKYSKIDNQCSGSGAKNADPETGDSVDAGSQAEGAGEPDGEGGVNGCDPIVGHDAQAARKRLRLSRGKGLPYIEHAEKNETEQQIFPAQRGLIGDEAGRGRRPGICSSPPYR
jgi:hypothetical protein